MTTAITQIDELPIPAQNQIRARQNEGTEAAEKPKVSLLQRLASGQSTRQIAQELQISIKTVETHRSELMRRLGIRDLAGLVRFAVRVGLVSAAG